MHRHTHRISSNWYTPKTPCLHAIWPLESFLIIRSRKQITRSAMEGGHFIFLLDQSMAVPLLQDVASPLWPSVFLIWKMEMTGLPYSFSRDSSSHFLLGRKGCILTIIPPISGLLPGQRHQSQTLTYLSSPLNSNLAPLCCNWGTRASSPLHRGQLSEETTFGAHTGHVGHLPNSLAQGPELHVDILIQIYCHLPRGKGSRGSWTWAGCYGQGARIHILPRNGACLLLLNMQCVGKGVVHGPCGTLHKVGAAHKKLLRIYDSTGFKSFHLWSNYKDKTSSHRHWRITS